MSWYQLPIQKFWGTNLLFGFLVYLEVSQRLSFGHFFQCSWFTELCLTALCWFTYTCWFVVGYEKKEGGILGWDSQGLWRPVLVFPFAQMISDWLWCWIISHHAHVFVVLVWTCFYGHPWEFFRQYSCSWRLLRDLLFGRFRFLSNHFSLVGMVIDCHYAGDHRHPLYEWLTTH